MELQTLWQLFHPVQACAVGDRCNPSPSYGGLCLVNMYEFSKRKRTVNRLSYRSDTGLFRPSLSRSQGSWRLERVNVMVVPLVQRLGDGVNNIEQENKGSIGLYYIFQTKEIVLGDGGDLSAAELKPCEIQQLSGSDIWMESLSSVHLGRRMPSEDLRKLQQEGLREYKDLKFSLLLYNVILVASGTSIMAIVGNQEISNGFAIGGVCGFIYLVLLERAVDRLPGSPSFSSNSTNEKSSFEDDNISGGQLVDVNESNMSSQVDSNKNFREMFLGFRGPSTSLIWIIATVFVASKYLPGNITIALKPQELLAGAAGFLTCKVAVVIAAFRTLSADWKNYRK